MADEIKRVVIDVDQKFHKDIKIRALYRNMSMKDYIIMAVVKQIQLEEQFEGKE